MSWIEAVPMQEIESKGRAVFRSGARQIAVMKSNGQIFAVDNRCPHEGYPLSEGTVNPENCILTCNWHNWKFDLKTGESASGEDSVNVYETRLQEGMIWVHIPEIPKETIQQKLLGQLHQAFLDQNYDRMVRELTRMHFQDIDLLLAVRKGVEWSHDRLEYGMDHAYAVTADWLSLFSEFSDAEQRLICIAESIDYMAESSLRQTCYPYSLHSMPFSKERFVAAVEAENETEAISMINAALAHGLHFADLEEALTEAALRHYNDFGHSLIYVTKVEKLVKMLGAGVERYLLLPLVRSICDATREDLLPEFRMMQHYLTESSAESLPEDADLFGKPVSYCLRWVSSQMDRKPPEKIYAALLRANATNLLHYDMQYQFSYTNPVSKNIGWLDFTHGITFANAVRKQCVKFPHLWKYGLLQMACFSGRNAAYLDRTIYESEWRVRDAEEFFSSCVELILDHGKSAPIFAAHYVKTFLAVKEEVEVASAECGRILMAALNRFLHSPLKEKHVRRTVRQAMELVGRDHRGGTEDAESN